MEQILEQAFAVCQTVEAVAGQLQLTLLDHTVLNFDLDADLTLLVNLVTQIGIGHLKSSDFNS